MSSSNKRRSGAHGQDDTLTLRTVENNSRIVVAEIDREPGLCASCLQRISQKRTAAQARGDVSLNPRYTGEFVVPMPAIIGSGVRPSEQ